MTERCKVCRIKKKSLVRKTDYGREAVRDYCPQHTSYYRHLHKKKFGKHCPDPPV